MLLQASPDKKRQKLEDTPSKAPLTEQPTLAGPSHHSDVVSHTREFMRKLNQRTHQPQAENLLKSPSRWLHHHQAATGTSALPAPSTQV